jgi:uncharacterized OB-fold protein
MDRNARLPESEEGTVLFNVDPVIIKQHYEIDYLHSYAQDSPFFVGLAGKKLLGSRCSGCGYAYATPRAHCMTCGATTEWIELPLEGRVHSWTVCHYSGEEFRGETPFTLVLVEFDSIDTLFLSRLIGAGPDEMTIGMPVRARFLRNARFKPTDVYFVPL